MKTFLSALATIISLQLMAQEFPIATGSYSQTYPSAVYANDAYYDAFLDKSTGSSSYGFHGKFIDPDGTVQPGENQIVPPISSLSFMHEIVWGETNYIFVWSRGRTSSYTRDAYAQMVGEDGLPQGLMVRVSIGNTESAAFVETAFDGENFLVVWQEGLPNNGSVIRAQFVSQEGQLVGDNFSVRPESLGTDIDQIYPDVKFDGEKFLVVWDDNRVGNRDIYGQFVSTSGEFIGNDIVITTQNADQFLVKLAFGGDNFFAVWADERLSSNDKSIYGQLIGLSGELIGENLLVSAQANSEGRSWPDVAASNGEYLAVWDQEWLEYKEGQDSRDGLEMLKYEAAGVDLPRPVIWYDIYARKISFQGDYLSDEIPVCTVDYHQQDCNVASDGADFLVSWSDSRNANQYYDIYGYIVEGSNLPQLPVINPEEIEFTNMNQFFDGGESFSITNPNDFEVLVDDIFFKAGENRYWYINEQPAFPLLIDAGSSVELSVNMDLPVGSSPIKSFETDTLVVQSMGAEMDLLLKIDEALLDTIFSIKMDFSQDSIFFENVEHTLEGETIGLINRHYQKIQISDIWFSGQWGGWIAEPEYVLPWFIFYKDTMECHVHTDIPIKETFSDEIVVDTMWFSSFGDPKKYWFPIYYFTEVFDTLTSVEPIIKEGYINVWPNPAINLLNISMPNSGQMSAEVNLVDLNGRIIREFRITNPENNLSLDISGIRPGIYLLKIFSQTLDYKKRILIVR